MSEAERDAVDFGPLPRPSPSERSLADFDAVPLFMRSLPEDDTGDIAISALQNLAHEGTPNEIAENFKEQGNNYFRGKRYSEARNFYTQGIDAKPTDLHLLDALLCNRAACNLELKNYGFVLRDCSRAIIVNSRSPKAYYRSALALVALERFEEALECCARLLDFDPENISIRSVHERCKIGKENQDRKNSERKERLRLEAETNRQLEIGLKARNLIQISSVNKTENLYWPHFAARAQGSELTLVVPVFFLYPQHATSDLISHYDEETPFGSHLDVMFPSSLSENAPQLPQWDKNREYLAPNLVVYAITHKKRLLKVGKQMTLLDLCKAAKGKNVELDGLELKDGYLSVVVLPKGEVESRWVDDFKANRNQ